MKRIEETKENGLLKDMMNFVKLNKRYFIILVMALFAACIASGICIWFPIMWYLFLTEVPHYNGPMWLGVIICYGSLIVIAGVAMLVAWKCVDKVYFDRKGYELIYPEE